MASGSSSLLTVESIVRGYHVYKSSWNPSTGDGFDVCVDEFNEKDRYAMKIVINEKTATVGHVPIGLSKIFYYFVRNGGTVYGEVTGKRQRSLTVDKGLEIPCRYVFTSTVKRNIKRLTKLLKEKITDRINFTIIE